ncbi:MAG: 16S rRNA (adenine(1518)-N(6)/adenine(1519)-N(6))-dimethyltransferase RsmA [Candidatus Spechtbacterales bacterium]|nr:16S rRNA (adenine(1518)-N(6)/adenine(1519)-N(6))-dimethyltransferase RsmA [Candidatus Spechtbacterales bacterium]
MKTMSLNGGKQKKIKEQFEKYGLNPNKVLGQNFLVDDDAVSTLIDAARIQKEDTIIEVGPGTGVITQELIKHAKQVTVVEKDPDMVHLLKEKFKNTKNIDIVEGDILKFKPPNSNYKIIGNPPYYLTARLFRHFLEEVDTPPSSIAVIIQKEVAEKISAKKDKMNLLAVSVQLYGEVGMIKKVSRSSFWPQPNVDSAILTVDNIQKPSIDEKKFFRLVRAGFSSPRKQLANNLSFKLKINKAKVEKDLKHINIEPSRRAETLTIEEWKKVENYF